MIVFNGKAIDESDIPYQCAREFNSQRDWEMFETAYNPYEDEIDISPMYKKRPSKYLDGGLYRLGTAFKIPLSTIYGWYRDGNDVGQIMQLIRKRGSK